MLALGLMSGTSADGVDAALIETDGHRVQRCGPALTMAYPPELRRHTLAVMADPACAEHDSLAELEAAVTQANLAAAQRLLAESGARVDVVGMHGQTVLHRPERRFTRQLGDGAALHEALGVPVVCNFRDADVASGGQGAPFAPLYHAALLQGEPGPLAVLNLGGVGNVTVIDGDTLLAFDTGPGNALLDDWIGRHTGEGFDTDGAIAARGRVDAAVLADLLAHPYFARTPPKSLDRNDFPGGTDLPLSLEDGAATLAAFTVGAVAKAREHMPRPPRRWLVCGGGRRNTHMLALLRAELNAPVDPVDSLGWDGDALEAQAFGFLAVRSLLGLPLSLPGTTGTPMPMTGGVVYPSRKI